VQIGMVGLGRMGSGMAERLRRAGHDVVGHDPAVAASQAGSLAELVGALPPPRVVWIMVPAGAPTEDAISTLGGLLHEGDVVIDGGNAHYLDSIRRGAELAGRGVGFLDVGVSGGVWGNERGYGLMVGGDVETVRMVQPVFDALTPAPGTGFAHAGPTGSGHFTKMVHNGVEYALMQAYAEGYELLSASELAIDVAATVEAWRSGTVVRSWLLDLLADALAQDPGLATVAGWADDSGEGRWTVQEAVRLAVPVPAISAALYARFASRQQDAPAMRVVAALRSRFGGHEIRTTGAAPGADPDA
jgi:6-phosphogluconate dehydrogenase